MRSDAESEPLQQRDGANPRGRSRQSIDIVWPLADSAHWYDLRLTSDHDKHFERRLAGHIETGQASTSDPAYGDGAGRIFGSGFE